MSVLANFGKNRKEIIVVDSQDKLNNDTTKEEKEVYSYHTFIFPFYFNDKDDKMKSIDTRKYKAILNKIVKSTNKKEDSTVNELIKSPLEYKGKLYDDKLEKVIAYNVKSYFTKPFNEIIGLGGDNDDFVAIYELNKANFDSCTYEIKKEPREKNDKKDYRLNIYNIKLKLYNNGVGLLIYELENREYNSLDDVNAINEFGRRIRAPYLSYSDDKQCSLVADKMTIYFKSSKNSNDDITIESNIIRDNLEYDTNYIPSVVSYFMPTNIKIESVDDDRMFVCCMVKDDSWSSKIKAVKWQEMRWEEKENLYKLAYIENGCSCQSDKMIDDLMARTMYDRWIKYGTCDFITNHSFIRLTSTSEDILDSVINPFLYIYVELAIIVLLQRATIKKVVDNLSESSCEMSKNKESIDEIAEYYYEQKAKKLFSKVTFQEQGDEEYKILRRELDIDALETECDNHFDALYNYYILQSQKKYNKRIFWLTVNMAILTLVSVAVGIRTAVFK